MGDVEAPNVVPYEQHESPPGSRGVARAGPGTGNIWTTEGDKALQDSDSTGSSSDEEEEEEEVEQQDEMKILLDKEFEDYYEDRVHKAAGPVVFISKCLGMLPVIWTDESETVDCKSYFNLYTFLVIICWFGVAILAGQRISLMGPAPSQAYYTPANMTLYTNFLGKMTLNIYSACVFTNCIVAVIFGVFKSRSFAEVLYQTSKIDSQLELKEKHYCKLKSKTLFWIIFLVVFYCAHGIGLFFVICEYGFDLVLFVCLVVPGLANAVLDLQYVHLSMVLCKRYRMLNRILLHVTQPFKTFRGDEPSHEILQKILSHKWHAVKKEEARNTFDQIWAPSENEHPSMVPPDSTTTKIDNSKEEVPMETWLKGTEREISREEENTVILQLDILRSIHIDLHNVGKEMNELLGFQQLVNIITNSLVLVLFGYFFAATAYYGQYYWPFNLLLITPIFRLLIIGHWAQIIKESSLEPFWSVSLMSTMDGSPRLERQVQKFSLQASKEAVKPSAAGYFNISRGSIAAVFGVIAFLVFFLVKGGEVILTMQTVRMTG